MQAFDEMQRTILFLWASRGKREKEVVKFHSGDASHRCKENKATLLSVHRSNTDDDEEHNNDDNGLRRWGWGHYAGPKYKPQQRKDQKIKTHTQTHTQLNNPIHLMCVTYWSYQVFPGVRWKSATPDMIYEWGLHSPLFPGPPKGNRFAVWKAENTCEAYNAFWLREKTNVTHVHTKQG